ncbi:Uncharacterised protein [uncultured archaeon]|nr:Uncharacterised protein [uncultured archaeon]
MKITKNKRGDKILSVYWFAIIIIVAGGIFGMVYVFYSTPYDTRQVEARLLINNLADCVSYDGQINSDLFSGGTLNPSENYLSKCHLTLNSGDLEAWKNNEQYYMEVKFYKISDLSNPISTLKDGNNNWLPGCSVQAEKKISNLAQCVERSFYSLDALGNQYLIKILGVVAKSEKNVKM